MPESRQIKSSKCFAAVLSRLLCSGGLPTHPSDQLIEPKIEKFEFPAKPEEIGNRSSSPGVVARLMGLESFPVDSQYKERTLGDFFRSRSVNSIDFLSHFDLAKPRCHRRVRTWVSFREGATDDFGSLVLLLDGGKIEEERGKNVEIKEKKRSISSKKSNLEGKRRADLKERRPLLKAVECEEKLKSKKNEINVPQETAPVARVARPEKLQPLQTANSRTQSSCSNTSFSDKLEMRVITAQKNEGEIKANGDFYYKKMVDEISMLTEKSVRQNWIYGMELKFENFEDMCQQFGQEILEVLLTQFVHELILYFVE
ncbi:hypothetical protein SASPL_135422 [Salvia splendens]|uniref:DUF3741 domain-containing protein n=1 Tax=Salvia splendens TaxID=180675 RepID=A0A8X8WZP4_SALSN|nr:uncharacterized protein LOC121760133 [Salvia splendens]KAG6403205.1 hypothetical protein SASPL_135422 [Salvia splendens]